MYIYSHRIDQGGLNLTPLLFPHWFIYKHSPFYVTLAIIRSEGDFRHVETGRFYVLDFLH